MRAGDILVRQIGHSYLMIPQPWAAAASYTVEERELCDRLPHKSAEN
jgi:hypothetical protein